MAKPIRQKSKSDIAVIGIGCWYPGAKGARELWENILSRRREFRLLPDVRLPLSEYHDPDPTVPDKTYGRKAAVIDGFSFDWAGKRIPKGTFEGTDIAQWLALEVAQMALMDAGFERETLPTERTGVILGNTLTGEHTRTNAMRLRWPFVRKVLQAASQMQGLGSEAQEGLAASMEVLYKSVFPAVTEDTLAGGLSNTIAGRICNFYNLHGGGYTVDGACTSSLLSVCTAADLLSNGSLDMVLAGGVDISLDTFELIGFAKTGALTPGEMAVYDRKASGFIPGEGCGFVVLKRLEDAERDGNFVYAVLKGWGISSDGKGGITAPSVEGQARALRRAYQMAGYSPRELDFIEGHGTGTKVGDQTELSAIAAVMNSSENGVRSARSCGLTSFKSIAGHTKAAAGIGAFIKAVIAVNRRVIPPTAGCEEPNAVFENAGKNLYPVLQGKVWDPAKAVRAGVSAMGFGGINSHVTLESAGHPSDKLAPALEERTLLVSNQKTEIFVFGASSLSELFGEISQAKAVTAPLSLGDLTDWAAHLGNKISGSPRWRVAVVAGTPEGLVEHLRAIESALRARPPADGELITSPQKDWCVGHNVSRTRVGFLFPGQGSQQVNMGRVLVERYAWARELVELADCCVAQAGGARLSELIFREMDRASGPQEIEVWKQELANTEIAQPAITLISLLYAHFLQNLGLIPAAVAGHSLGELTAFHLAGAFDEVALLELVTLRGQAMAAKPHRPGAMASLSCSLSEIEGLLREGSGHVVVANINSPKQVVISGEEQAVLEIMAIAESREITSRRLAVSNAFHSHLVEAAATQIRERARLPDQLGTLSTHLFSSLVKGPVQPGIDLKRHFSSQIVSPVNFVHLVSEMQKACDFFVEVGPGLVLTSLVHDIAGSGHPCFPVVSRRTADRDLNTLLAYAFASGIEICWAILYEGRLVRPFIRADQRVFIENPCERPLKGANSLAIPKTSLPLDLFNTLNCSESELQAYLTKRHEFLAEVIRADMKYLSRPFNQEQKDGFQDILSNLEEAAVALRTLEPASLKARPVNPEQKDRFEEILIDLAFQRTGYPRESITLEMRLLDDLNLDSIKATELVASAAREAGMAGKLDASRFATAKLEEVALALRALQPARSVEITPIQSHHVSAVVHSRDVDHSDRKRYPSWVREFAIELREQPLPTEDPERVPAWWQDTVCFIISEDEERKIAVALQSHLEALGARCTACSYPEAVPADSLSEGIEFIALLPQRGKGSLPEQLSKMVQRLSRIGDLILDPHGHAHVGLTLVQFGGGSFGAGKEPVDMEVCSAPAFARSLHLERPGLRVRVIDCPSGLESRSLAEVVAKEVPGDESFKVVGYDTSLTRKVPHTVLQDPSQYKARALTWTQEDVVLVTGGAKGITAECALALAKKTGVQLALVGTSSLEAAAPGSELRKNLERFQREGIRFRYYACDVADADAVNELVRKVQKEMGSVTCVIHGAGLNKPRRIEQVSASEALREVSPKILGAYHLWHALQSMPPQFFIAFTSIINVTGMPGNAWYAFSNEALDSFLRMIRSASPSTQTVALAYSLWGETGMGVRMGSVQQLDHWGIDTIPTEEGVKRFLKLFERDPGHPQLVITARLGGLDTWPSVNPLPDDLRFIDEIKLFQPNVELLTRTRLTLERDRYLKDHVFRGSHLFPAVFGLEAMAQAVTVVTGESSASICRIEDIGLEKPIIVNPEHGLEIEIYALAEESTRSGERAVQVGIRTEQTGFVSDHFSATFVLGTHRRGGVSLSALKALKKPPLGLDPKTQLYGSILFQGPLFQRIEAIYELDEHHTVFESKVVEPIPYPGIFGNGAAGRIVLGDPFLRDALLQSLQLTVPQEICLPVRIEKIELYNAPIASSSKRIVAAPSKARKGREYQTEVFVTDEQGRIHERMTGYWLRIMEEHPEHPRPEKLANDNSRHTGSTFGKVDSLDPKTNLVRVNQVGLQGQTVFECSQLVSFYESSALSRHVPVSKYALWMGKMREAVLAAGAPQIAGKLATAEWGMVTNWTDLRILGEVTANDTVLMRLWGDRPKGSKFRYCCEFWKIAGKKRERIAYSEQEATWVRLTGHGQVSVEPLPADLKRFIEEMAQETDTHKPLPEPQGILSHLDLGAPVFEATAVSSGGRPLYTYLLQATLEDANQVGNVYFANYIAWQNRARELFLFSVNPDYLRGTGENGEMITLRSRVDHLREAMPFDRIAVVLYLRSVRERGAIFGFEYFRVLPDGSRLKLAIGHQEVAWVKRKNGLPVATPFPHEFQKALIEKGSERAA